MTYLTIVLNYVNHLDRKRATDREREREREKGKSEIYICLLGTFLLERVLSCAVQTSEIQNLVRIT